METININGKTGGREGGEEEATALAYIYLNDIAPRKDSSSSSSFPCKVGTTGNCKTRSPVVPMSDKVFSSLFGELPAFCVGIHPQINGCTLF